MELLGLSNFGIPWCVTDCTPTQQYHKEWGVSVGYVPGWASKGKKGASFKTFSMFHGLVFISIIPKYFHHTPSKYQAISCLEKWRKGTDFVSVLRSSYFFLQMSSGMFLTLVSSLLIVFASSWFNFLLPN